MTEARHWPWTCLESRSDLTQHYFSPAIISSGLNISFIALWSPSTVFFCPHSSVLTHTLSLSNFEEDQTYLSFCMALWLAKPSNATSTCCGPYIGQITKTLHLYSLDNTYRYTSHSI